VPVTELQPGDPDRIGPYRVLSRLGSGGMGIVYLVQAGAGLGALKLIRPQLADDPEFRARFRREVEAGRAVAGPYTARYIDAEVEGPTPYLVTEYVDGPSLGEAVADGGPFGFEAVVGLASGLAEALQAIHAVGVIHRDLKPSNVILAQTGPRIIDFGISRALEATSLTGTGLSVGSPPWMAPEAARGEAITIATDVFAWGGVVAFASTGRLPFGEGRPEAVLYRIVHEQPDLDGVDPRLLPVIRGALAREPNGRPTPSALLASLKIAAGAHPPDPTEVGTAVMTRTQLIVPDNAPDITRKLQASERIKSRRLVAAAAVAVLVLVGAGIALASTRANRSAGLAPGSTTSTKSSTSAPNLTTTTVAPRLTSTELTATQLKPVAYKVLCTYPKVTGGSQAITAKLNASLAAQVNRAVANLEHGFTPLTPAPTTDMAPFDGFNLDCTWAASLQQPTLFSILLTMTINWPVEAHPLASFQTFNFNPETGQVYSLSDLFLPGSNWLGELSADSQQSLETQLGQAAFPAAIVAGTSKASDFSLWTLKPDGLVIQFAEGQIGPYASGSPTVLIPTSALATLASPNGPLSLIGGPVAATPNTTPATAPTTELPTQAILAPATVPPVVVECSVKLEVTYGHGGAMPLICPSGGLNVLAWRADAELGSDVMSLGRSASWSQVTNAMCIDMTVNHGTGPEETGAAEAASYYYGWAYLSRIDSWNDLACSG